MKILVTGTAGFIGMHTAEKLLARGDTVIGLDNMNDYYDVTLKKARLARLMAHANYRHVHADLADRPAMESLFAVHCPERVIHLAAERIQCRHRCTLLGRQQNEGQRQVGGAFLCDLLRNA